MSNDVTEPRQEYTRMLPSVTKNRLAVAGQRAVRKAGTKCLAPLASMMCETIYKDDIAQVSYSTQMTTEGSAKYPKYLNNP